MALGMLVVAMVMTPGAAVVAQERAPSGSELRQTYPLGESKRPAPPARDTRNAPPAVDSRTAPPATRPADGGSSVKPLIALGLAVLAFAAGFIFGFRPLRRRLPGALRVPAGGQR